MVMMIQVIIIASWDCAGPVIILQQYSNTCSFEQPATLHLNLQDMEVTAETPSKAHVQIILCICLKLVQWCGTLVRVKMHRVLRHVLT